MASKLDSAISRCIAGGRLLCMLAAACSGIASAEDPPPPAPPPMAVFHPGGPGLPPGPGAGPGEWPPGPGEFSHSPGEIMPPPVRDAMRAAREIERLYREEGKPREVVALYQDILDKAKEPVLRNFALESLAHAELEPADREKAIATLKQSLQESLHRAEEELPQHVHPGAGAQEAPK
jgi:hypothetical protein